MTYWEGWTDMATSKVGSFEHCPLCGEEINLLHDHLGDCTNKP